MTERLLTRWTCDRCGIIEEPDDPEAEPQLWARIAYALPPRAAAAGTKRLADLCPGCWTELRHFLNREPDPILFRTPDGIVFSAPSAPGRGTIWNGSSSGDRETYWPDAEHEPDPAESADGTGRDIGLPPAPDDGEYVPEEGSE